MKDYYIISEKGFGEITEKKSRFIANVLPAGDEEEAVRQLEAVKRKYWDARHNCYAFVAGQNDETQRCSDDGEPSGTAGKPILEVIHGKCLHQCVIVVTRYFGGTLLGTGGLVRAYTAAAEAGLKDAVVRKRVEGMRITADADYADLARMQHIAVKLGITFEDVQYAEKVRVRLTARREAGDEFIRLITDSSAGRVSFDTERNINIYIDADIGKK